jgi:hypothetical protein
MPASHVCCGKRRRLIMIRQPVTRTRKATTTYRGPLVGWRSTAPDYGSQRTQYQGKLRSRLWPRHEIGKRVRTVDVSRSASASAASGRAPCRLRRLQSNGVLGARSELWFAAHIRPPGAGRPSAWRRNRWQARGIGCSGAALQFHRGNPDVGVGDVVPSKPDQFGPRYGRRHDGLVWLQPHSTVKDGIEYG